MFHNNQPDHAQRLIQAVLNFLLAHWIHSIALIVLGTITCFIIPSASRRLRAFILSSIVIPVAFTTLYLVVSRWLRFTTSATVDQSAIVSALVLGLILVSVLPIHPFFRVLGGILYAPVMGSFLLGYGFFFTCAVFNDCL